MKKYIILFTVTALVITAILAAGSTTNAAVKAELYTVISSDGENIVNAAGRLQYADSRNVKSDNYMLIGSLYVADGDTVKKDDPVMTVYTIPDSEKLTRTFPELSEYVKLITKAELTDDIIEEIKKYTVEKIMRAPADGIVNSINYTENSIAEKGSILFRVSDKKARCIKANINENSIESIKKDQPVSIRFSAISGRRFKGTVYSISNEAKQTGVLTGKETAVEITIKLEGEDKRLKIGYTAECEIQTSVDRDIIIIPYEYIHSDESGDYVFILKKDRSVKRYVKTGKEYKNGVSIKSGLKVNDIIIRPDDDIAEGQKILSQNGG